MNRSGTQSVVRGNAPHRNASETDTTGTLKSVDADALTKFAVAMNNLALLATTSMLTPTFAAADASQAFAHKTTTGMTKLATANALQR